MSDGSFAANRPYELAKKRSGTGVLLIVDDRRLQLGADAIPAWRCLAAGACREHPAGRSRPKPRIAALLRDADRAREAQSVWRRGRLVRRGLGDLRDRVAIIERGITESRDERCAAIASGLSG